MTLIQLLDMANTVKNLLDSELPFAVSYKFTKLAAIIEGNQTYYQEQIRILFEKYGEKDDDGNLKQEKGNVLLRPDMVEEFYTQLNELQSVKLSETFPRFTVAELENISISPRDLYPLTPLINE